MAADRSCLKDRAGRVRAGRARDAFRGDRGCRLLARLGLVRLLYASLKGFS